MKREMSSFDVGSIAAEMSALEGGHMDKVFQWDSGTVLFRINVSGQGKRDLFFKGGKWLYLPSVKPETPMNPLSFATFLRKHLDNARIGRTTQQGFDRMLVTEVFKADADYRLIFELFGGGNILLVKDGVIVNCLIHKTMRDRAVRPGEPYVMPKVRFDPVSSPREEFDPLFSASSSDAVRTLATGAGLGGQYAEEVCRISGVAKNTPAGELTPEDIGSLWDAMRTMVSGILENPVPTMYTEGDEVVDITPADLGIYSSYERTVFPTMSSAVEELMSRLGEKEEGARKDPELERLRRRIESQTDTVEAYREEAATLRAKADALYANYGQADELLRVLKEQSSKLTWEKLKTGAMRIPFVRSIDPSKSIVVAVFDGMDVQLDYTRGLDANASDIYAKGKEIGEKSSRAEEALADSKAAFAKREKGLAKDEAARAARAQPTKQFWFERYKWFITSGGKLVIAGKDAHTNDNIVKKHLKDADVYAHADLHGAPSTILKDGQKASDAELREACHFALAQSKGWVAALSDGSAYWVYPDQVSKTPEAGEFVPRGAFIIRGRRNYEYHLPMRLAVGEIAYQNERKVMCGPEDAMRSMSSKYFVIIPGRGKAGKTAAHMAKELGVPEEEVARIIPPGDCEIASKVWSEESEQQS